MKAKHKLEHALWAVLRDQGLVGRRLLLACSGGADSVALVRAFAAIRPSAELVVAYVHHGADGADYRDRAEKFVRELAEEHRLAFASFRHRGPAAKSEKSLRILRRRALEDLRLETKCDLIATAHHRDDLLETRLIRLLRGTGPEGLPAIRVLRGAWFRPFLAVGGSELRAYLEKIGRTFLDDPSNEDRRFLRNWMRREWLPALETYRPGAGDAMARSLEGIVESLHRDEIAVSSVIERPVWEKSAPAERLRMLASCLRASGQFEMTRGQLEEIRKRLDNRRREYTFEVAGCVWTVNVQQIQARRQG